MTELLRPEPYWLNHGYNNFYMWFWAVNKSVFKFSNDGRGPVTQFPTKITVKFTVNWNDFDIIFYDSWNNDSQNKDSKNIYLLRLRNNCKISLLHIS